MASAETASMGITAMQILGLYKPKRDSESLSEEAVLQRLRKDVRGGFSPEQVASLGKITNLPFRDLLKFIDLSERTYLRRKSDGKLLTPSQSDRLLRVARIFARAEHVLGSREKASAFIQKPNRALGGETPFTHLDTELGEDAVLEVLGRIEHGIVG